MLNFVIVVFAVGFALWSGEWINDKQKRANLGRVEITMHSNLFDNYFYAQGRLAVVTCRKDRIRSLAEQLIKTGPAWVGTTMTYDGVVYNTALSEVLMSSLRGWESQFGEAKFARDTFELMDETRRAVISSIFSQAARISGLQHQI